MIKRLNRALDGRHRIECVLDAGGMATVCLAEDPKHDRKVGLTVPEPELAAVMGAGRLPLFDSGDTDGFSSP